jgi:MFS family permease
MAGKKFKVYPYRWVVLSVFMLVNVMMQVLWICYAPVASEAAKIYGVGRTSIDLLANLFMIAYIPVSFLASWAIDRFGFKTAVGVGAVLMAVFGLLRAAFPNVYFVALIGSIGIAIGQPFLMNAFTKFAALWFSLKQRATITGLLFLSVFLGIGLGEALGPGMVGAFGFGGMQTTYGVISAITAVLFCIFARSKPPTPVGAPEEEARALVLDGLKRIVKQREVYLLCFALFLSSGIVNGVFTLIDGIGREKGFSPEQGIILTSILLLSGIFGSIVLPLISDRFNIRKPIILLGIIGGAPATLLLTYAHGFGMEITAFFLLGFFITGVTPVAYQYGAEITHPAPEGTSNGIFAVLVQASGFIILAMDGLKRVFHDSYLPSFAALSILIAISGALFLLAKESPEMKRRGAAPGDNHLQTQV